MPEPIAMILFCPVCHMRHIDRGLFATRPHCTHVCQSCGLIWRPAPVPTVGVRFLPNTDDPGPKDYNWSCKCGRIKLVQREGTEMPIALLTFGMKHGVAYCVPTEEGGPVDE